MALSFLPRLPLALARTRLPAGGPTVYLHAGFLQRGVLVRRSIRCLSTTQSQVASSFQVPDTFTTAGKVLHYINTECKDDDISDAQIRVYVEYVKEPQDFPGLLHALTSYKRTRNYVMSTDTADRAIAKVLESSTSIEGPLWVLENFKERTGLYFSASVSAINKALDALVKRLNVDTIDDDTEKERMWKALIRVTEGLIRRKTVKWGRGLKKRAKREYLRCLQTTGGPNQHTVRRVVEIGVIVKSKEETRQTLLQPYQVANVSIHPLTMERLEESEKMESDEGVVDGEANESEEQQDKIAQDEPSEEIDSSPENEESLESEKKE